MANDRKSKSENFSSTTKGVIFGILGLTLPFLLVTSFVISGASNDLLVNFLGNDTAEILKLAVQPFETVWSYLPQDVHMFIVGFIIVLSVFLLILAYFHIRLKSTLTRKQKASLLDTKEYVIRVIKSRKRQLYDEYLRQSVAEHEL